MILLIPCIYPIIWVLVAILMLLKWIFVDCWFIWATIGIIWLSYYLIKGIRFGFNSIGDTKKKRKTKVDFLETLIQTYNLPLNDESVNIDKRISDALSTIIGHMSCDNHAICLFENVVTEFNNKLDYSSKITTGTLDSNLGSVNGLNIRISNAGWPKVDSDLKAVSIKWKNSGLYMYPYFCIYETCDGIELIEWQDILTSSTKGNPSYYSYLHERVGGGPDRRYKFNPSIPVYLYSALVFNNAKWSINIILNGENEAERLDSTLQKFRNKLVSSGGVSMDKILESDDVHKDEYASLFKSIIAERGMDIVKEKLFISMLADYKVFREKTYLRSLLVTMSEEGYWSELIGSNSPVDSLNRIKKNFITLHKYPEHEVTEAMSYIGYGLGIIA